MYNENRKNDVILDEKKVIAVAENKIDANEHIDDKTKSGEPKVKKNVKDSVFVKLFGETNICCSFIKSYIRKTPM